MEGSTRISRDFSRERATRAGSGSAGRVEPEAFAAARIAVVVDGDLGAGTDRADGADDQNRLTLRLVVAGRRLVGMVVEAPEAEGEGAVRLPPFVVVAAEDRLVDELALRGRDHEHRALLDGIAGRERLVGEDPKPVQRGWGDVQAHLRSDLDRGA